jgi:hypothetical protein
MYIYFVNSETGALAEDITSISFPYVELPVGSSLIPQRYRLVGGVLTDIYAGHTDSEVLDLLAGRALFAGSAMNPVKFKLRLTVAERVAVYASADPVVMDFLRILDDSRLDAVYKDTELFATAVPQLVALNLLGPERAEEIMEW